MKSFALLILLAATPTIAKDAATVFERVRESVASVITLNEKGEADGEGSGVVTDKKQVITNCHVISDASKIVVKSGTRQLSAELQYRDLKRDLCSLIVNDLAAPNVSIRSYGELRIGEPVYAIGNPLGFELTVSAGLISLLGDRLSEPRIITTAALSPGSSGGGLFDIEGRLVGVTTASFRRGQNVNLAVPSDWIAELPERSTPHGLASPEVPPDRPWLGEAEQLQVAQKWPELLSLSEKFRQAYPTSADANTFAALALFNLNRLEEALAILIKTTREHPLNAGAWGYLGMVREKMGEKQAAETDFKTAIKLHPAAGFFSFSLARLYIDARKLEQADLHIADTIRLHPGDPRHWAALSDIQFRQKQYEQSLQSYRIVRKADPKFDGVLTNLAIVQAALGQTADARETLKTSTNPNIDAITWLNIGIAEERKNLFSEAEKAYRKAIELAPKNASAWHRLGANVLRTNRKDEAENAFRQAILFEPRSPLSLLALGNIQRSNGKSFEAFESYQKATSYDPKFVEGWRAAAYLTLSSNRLASIDALQKVVALEPNAATDWALLGDALNKLNRNDEAEEALLKAEAISPENLTMLHALSSYFSRTGEYLKSLNFSERALKVDASNVHSWSNKGYSLLKLQRFPESIEALETAVRLRPDFANAWINLGEANLRSQQLSRAIAALDKALKIEPNAVDARSFQAQAYLQSGLTDNAKQHVEMLLQRQPNLPAAWHLLAIINLTQGKQTEMVAAYLRLKGLQPTLANDFKEKLRANPAYREVLLPE